MIYPLAGAAVGTLLSKAIIPLNTLQSALWVGGLATTTAVGEQGLHSLLNFDKSPVTKIAFAIGISAALLFASLSASGASLLGRLSDGVTTECFLTLLASSLIPSLILAFKSSPKKPASPAETPKPDKKSSTKPPPKTPPTTKYPEKTVVQKTTLEALHGDIMLLEVEAIVNAANEVLLGGSGIDGAIHSKAGPELVKECAKFPFIKGSSTNRIKTGDAVITSSYDIQKEQPAIKYIVHTAGPRSTTPNRKEILANAYRNSLEVARQKGVRSIAFPAISVGIFGYPFEEAQEVAFKTVRDFVEKHPDAFDKVLFSYLFKDPDKITAINQAWNKTF